MNHNDSYNDDRERWAREEQQRRDLNQRLQDQHQVFLDSGGAAAGSNLASQTPPPTSQNGQ